MVAFSNDLDDVERGGRRSPHVAPIEGGVDLTMELSRSVVRGLAEYLYVKRSRTVWFTGIVRRCRGVKVERLDSLVQNSR